MSQEDLSLIPVERTPEKRHTVLYEEHAPSLHHPFKVWFHRSYISDWLIMILAAGFTAIMTEEVLGPTTLVIPDRTDNVNVSYPLKNDIVPTWSLLFFDILFPILMFLLVWVARRSNHDLHHASLGLFAALAVTYIFTSWIKVAAGRPRPDYLDMKEEGDGREAKLSFPSGHSSISWAAQGFLSSYLAGKLHVFNNWSRDSFLRNNSLLPLHAQDSSHPSLICKIVIQLIKNMGIFGTSLICLAPLSLSAFIAVSRTVDYHHNYSDILAGAILGGALSVYYYLAYFHSLFSTNSHFPRTRWAEER